MHATQTIEQIETTPVAGNAFSDGPLMRAIHEFMLSDAAVADKMRALRKLDQVMGVESEVTEASVAEYLREAAEYE